MTSDSSVMPERSRRSNHHFQKGIDPHPLHWWEFQDEDTPLCRLTANGKIRLLGKLKGNLSTKLTAPILCSKVYKYERFWGAHMHLSPTVTMVTAGWEEAKWFNTVWVHVHQYVWSWQYLCNAKLRNCVSGSDRMHQPQICHRHYQGGR